MQRRAERLELPAELVKERAAPAATPTSQEERRLFYVAMTRARDELVLTSAADYGTARARKVSRFVVEALDLPSPAPLARQSQALEALARHQAVPEPPPALPPPMADDQVLRLSFGQIDDYETCPLKYRYVHVLRVPLLAHHRVVYGSAMHKAVQQHFRARLEGRPFNEDDLVQAFRSAWVSEGFLSREHEEQRLRAGEETLRRFHRAEAVDPLHPTGGRAGVRLLRRPQPRPGPLRPGRGAGRPGVTSSTSRRALVDDPKKARERAKDSLQLDVYALAHLRTTGRLPDWVELRFLESGLAAGRKPTLEEAEAAEERIRGAAALIRGREFPATPSYMACGQCAFRDICPHTARGPEADD